MERIRRGFRLLGASWAVLKADRELLVLPVLSFLGILVVALLIAGAGWGLGSFDRVTEDGAAGAGPLEYALTGTFYFLAYFVGIFFNAAIVGAATIRLQGGDPTLKDGLSLAWSKRGKIAGWAAVSATVGIILRSLEERFGFVGRIVITIIGAAWAAVTFFVVPVLLYEPVGVIESVKRSGRIFKERWGEQFVGNASIGLAIFLIAIPVFAVAGVLIAAMPIVGIPVAVVAVGLLIAAGGAMSGIFNAALYRYATTGEALGMFSESDLGGGFRPKGRSRG
ncbi:MAG: DUF6159 family protein [Actinomycetota bacterium]